MRYAFLSSALAVTASAHGTLWCITGANNVTMPGLCVADGTPRNCHSNNCGAQADTVIMRDREMSLTAGGLGRTQGHGKCTAAPAVLNFMGKGTKPAVNSGNKGAPGIEDDLSGLAGQPGGASIPGLPALPGGKAGQPGGASIPGLPAIPGGLGKLLGRSSETTNSRYILRKRQDIAGMMGSVLNGFIGGGGKKYSYPVEQSVQASRGMGAKSGLPTCDPKGIRMIYRQVNQDGAGPLSCSIDPTSGGTDPNAFQQVDVPQNVPGVGVGGLSTATQTDFPLVVQFPPGMTCKANVGGVPNVCVIRCRNGAGAGPFGGSAVCVQAN